MRDRFRFACLVICVISLLSVSVETEAVTLKHLTQEYRIEEVLDISLIVPEWQHVSESGDTSDIPYGEIFDYFCREGRLVHLARWEAEPEVVERADSILNNRYRFWVHDEMELPEDPEWSENPGSNRNWVYHLHSFDFLWILSEAYRMTGDLAYLSRGLDLVIDYAGDNCNFKKLRSGLCWYDHTAANRMIFLTDSWPLFVENGMIDRHKASVLLEFVWRHARFIQDNSNYASRNNHGTFSNVALLRLAAAFPEFVDSGQWRDIAVERMNAQLRDNFSSLGIHKEFSPWYQIWSAAVLTKYLEDCRLCGVKLSSTFLDKHSKIVNASACFIHPDNTISLAGDSGIEPDEKLMRRFVSERLEGIDNKTIACLETGVFVMRSEGKRRSSYRDESCLMAFFTGKAHAHDHRDPFNFELYSTGQKWITDSGRYAYEKDKQQRKYVISQRAHNTIIPYVLRKSQKRNRTEMPYAGDKRSEDIENGTEPETLSILSARSSGRDRSLDEFLEKNSMLVESVGAEGADRVADQEELFEKINLIQDVDMKIAIYQHLLEICRDNIRDKIFIMIAMVYMEKDNNKAMRQYLDRIIDLGRESEYYDIAVQLIETMGTTEPDVGNGMKVADPAMTGKNKVDSPEGKADRETRISDREQYVQMVLNDTIHPDILEWRSGKEYDYLEGRASYDFDVSHSRAILFVKPHYFVILDRVASTLSNLRIDQIFHFPPEVDLKDRGDGEWLLSVRDSLFCRMIPLVLPDSLDTSIIKGERQPVFQGWYSAHYNELVPSPAMVSRCDSLKGANYIAYLFVPTGTDDPDEVRVSLSGKGNWDPAEGEPIDIKIEDRSHKTTISYAPSSSFIYGEPAAAGGPAVEIRRRKR